MTLVAHEQHILVGRLMSGTAEGAILRRFGVASLSAISNVPRRTEATRSSTLLA